MDAIKLTERDICQGYVILVNRQHSIRTELFQGTQRLVPADPRYPETLLASQPAALLTRLIQDCGGQGRILPVSGYRTLREQTGLFDDSLRRNGREFTHRFVAFPNCSEHQTGLAIDLAENKPNIDLIRPDFPYTGVFGAFRDLAAEYGFVERYPKGKEAVTGIAFEPWHFRYVGYPHAKIMRDKGLALEEYLEFIRGFPYPEKAYLVKTGETAFRISFVQVERDHPVSISRPDGWFWISGNNADGVIVTSWEQET